MKASSSKKGIRMVKVFLMAEVELSGASDMRVSAAEKVIGKASGASSLYVTGNASVDVMISGASSVSKR